MRRRLCSASPSLPWLPLAIGVGTALGVALGNLAAGLALGLIFGLVMRARATRTASRPRP